MLQKGILASEDASKVAEAHVRVYEEMDYGACGRYICYGRMIKRLEEAIQIENDLKLPGLLSGEETNNNAIIDLSRRVSEIHYSPGNNISNVRLTKLLARSSRYVPCRYS